MIPSDLNFPQRAAIRYLDGPLLVLAGAGSGKTRVITHKIAYLIREGGFSPRNIAAITFTNKAAKEMLERLNKLMPSAETRGITVSTFHALGMMILRQESTLLGYKPQFSILDAADAAHIIAENAQVSSKEEWRKIQTQIGLWKNQLITPEQQIHAAQNDWEAYCARIYLAYQDTLMAYQAMDFDDLIRLPAMLFNANPECLHKWQQRLRYWLIDEYQDTNACQYELVKQLTGERGMFTAVGDDDQSIYAWRGASLDNLRRLQEDFPKLNVIKLEQNYRSTARILRAANAVIANNPKLFEKKLWSDLGMGDPIHVHRCKDEEHEAEMVIQHLLAHKFEHRTTFKDYAILYRGNYQAKVIEKALRNQRIPYQIAGGQSFFEKAEIKDVLAYMRLLTNLDDDAAFVRALITPKKGIGNATLERLGAWSATRSISLFAAAFEEGLLAQMAPAQRNALEAFCQWILRVQEKIPQMPAASLIMELLNHVQYEAWLYEQEESTRQAEIKWNNVLELVDWLARKGTEKQKNLVELTQTIALLTMLENRDSEEVDAVKLSTLHASKGLEYPHVFLVGVEEGILPHSESIDNGMVEEERRLMYVGITRAQRSLTITYCIKRKRGGEWAFCDASRFIGEIDEEDLRHFGRKNAEPQVSKHEGKQRLAQLSELLAQKSTKNPKDV